MALVRSNFRQNTCLWECLLLKKPLRSQVYPVPVTMVTGYISLAISVSNSRVEDDRSASCRTAAFAWLRQQVFEGNESLSRDLLERGFPYLDAFVKLVGPQGIFKPAQIQYFPLSITTTTSGKYSDSFDPDGDFILYSYRGTDPQHHENMRLRDAMHQRVPLIYFYGTIPGQYLAIFPVFIVDDDPTRLTFTVAVDNVVQLHYERDDADDTMRRKYITRVARQRMHQRSFRDRVLRAYDTQCSICRLKHSELLDAAHITPDNEPEGEPVVSNGVSLCKIHHAAFDRHFFGIRPDYRIVVRPQIMKEEDGPMLKTGLQQINNVELTLPRRAKERPDAQRLEVRYKSFQELAST